MSALMLCTEFYTTMPLYRLAVHAALALLVLGIIQLVFDLGPHHTAVMPPVVSQVGSYSSPFPAIPPSQAVAPLPTDKPADNPRLVPREHPELHDVGSVQAPANGIAPFRRPDLENIIVDPSRGGSAVQPQSHPELEGLSP